MLALRAKKRRGFTIIEILTSLYAFGILSLIVMAVLIMGMRYLNRADREIITQQTCRNVLDIMATDIQQGVANPYPDAPSDIGYRGIKPEVTSTSVLVPNANNINSENLIVFNILNCNNFPATPIPTPFVVNKLDPSIYKRVKYYISNNILYREINSLKNDGSLNNTSTTQIAQAQRGSLSFLAKYISPNAFEITFTITEDKNLRSQRTYTDTITVTILSQ